MIAEQTYRLEDFISELSAFSFSDVLVDLDAESKGVFVLEENIREQLLLPYSGRFNQLYKIAVQYKKVSDIQSLCAARFLIRWKVKERLVSTPLLLVPVHCSWNKVKQEFKLVFDEENTFVNPFISHYLQREFGLEMPVFGENETSVPEFLRQSGFELECSGFQAIGNFHYHRFELIKDLEELASQQEPNALVRKLLGESAEEKTPALDLVKERCFESDRDQEAIFEHFRTEDLVLQGPPGTGKTQVLSNLVAKLLSGKRRQLVLSEKKTALDVLEKKLKTRNLHHFVFLSHSQGKAYDFVMKLKNTWDFLEKWEGKEAKNLALSEQYEQQIQLSFDKLNQNTFWNEYTLQEMQDFVQSPAYEKLPFVTALPEIDEWKTIRPLVDSIYQNIKNPQVLGKIKAPALKIKVDELLEKVKSQHDDLKRNFDFNNLDELRRLNRKAIVLQLLHNEQAQKYAGLLDSERDIKKYEKLKKQYRLLNQKLEAQENETHSWKQIPSLSEVESWLQFLQKSSWLQKRKTKKHISQILKGIPLDLGILLQRTRDYLQTKAELHAVIHNLFGLGIEKPEFELSVIDYVLTEKNKIFPQEWQAVRELKKADQHILLQSAQSVKNLVNELEDYFHLSPEEELEDALTLIHGHLAALCAQQQNFRELPPAVYRNLHVCNSAEQFEQLVLKSNWVRFASAYPELARFTGGKLSETLASLSREEEQEAGLFAKQLIAQRKQRFKAYHHLLQQPSSRLKGGQKELRAQLKAGKALLVKEFAKSRQHKSMRELMTSDARLWIDLLTPVHLSTPAHLSRNIPLEKGFFECVIFDEASQLALPKAICSLQRAERMLVAGDSQQMAPGSFFSGMRSGVDLLHQASYYLKQYGLKHHYRSVHPELIRFSNRHFYSSGLIVYPSAQASHKALQWHYVEKGVFDERQNVAEAAAVAGLIEAEIKKDKTLGIVAFSEHQLSCIWKQIKPEFHALIDERIRENRVFFKALEQVQGEECDTLIISLGYGRNKEGQFHHRFGPLNQKNGTKRLNVLFTRAIEQIHFFSSVKASDFQLSANEAINLLRLYLLDLETENKEEESGLPFGIRAEISGKEMTIPRVYRQLPDVAELKTFHEVMQKRGWKIKYVV
ncbi:MAG: hypothetical protein K0R65_2459 [Crocinitomicaceae bacterium]|nr:hypothetical protein [Crocinitomicaceae bacterium]